MLPYILKDKMAIKDDESKYTVQDRRTNTAKPKPKVNTNTPKSTDLGPRSNLSIIHQSTNIEPKHKLDIGSCELLVFAFYI